MNETFEAIEEALQEAGFDPKGAVGPRTERFEQEYANAGGILRLDLNYDEASLSIYRLSIYQTLVWQLTDVRVDMLPTDLVVTIIAKAVENSCK